MDEPNEDAAPPRVFGAAVLDANVLYPAPLRDLLLRLAEQGLYRPRWSAQILEELRRNIVADRRSNEERAQRLLTEMRRHFLGAEVRPRPEVIERMTNAVEDRHVLAVAVQSGADIIVTSNLRDFPATALAPLGVEAHSPDEFLRQMYESDPQAIVKVLVDQAAALIAPPLTVDDVLNALDLHAPQTLRLIRETENFGT